MRQTKTILVAFLFATLLVGPALSGSNYAAAYVAEDEFSEEAEDATILEDVAIGTLALGIIEKLFCPKTPQNRCKSHICKPGACISFRAACDGTSAC